MGNNQWLVICHVKKESRQLLAVFIGEMYQILYQILDAWHGRDNLVLQGEHPSHILPSNRFSSIVQTSILEYLRLEYVTMFSSCQ